MCFVCTKFLNHVASDIFITACHKLHSISTCSPWLLVQHLLMMGLYFLTHGDSANAWGVSLLKEENVFVIYSLWSLGVLKLGLHSSFCWETQTTSASVSVMLGQRGEACSGLACQWCASTLISKRLKENLPPFPHLRMPPHLHCSCEWHNCLSTSSVSGPVSSHADT